MYQVLLPGSQNAPRRFASSLSLYGTFRLILTLCLRNRNLGLTSLIACKHTRRDVETYPFGYAAHKGRVLSFI